MTSLSDLDLFGAAAFDRDAAAANPLKQFREILKKGAATLKNLFEKGLQASELVPARARFIDHLLRQVWPRFFGDDDPNLALVAVGGYGRGELHPGSDIDLMILLGDDDLESRKNAIEHFLTFLWDIGLEVGQSVRTIEDCAREAANDITVTTNLMESRLLIGPEALFLRMRDVTGPKHIWPSAEFFEAKWKEQFRRHQKYDNTAYNLEPDVKEGPGGLRDLQMIGWVAKRHFGATTLHELVEHGFLTEAEYRDLTDCQNFLWQVRFALHTLAGRREDRLLFDYQSRLAKQLGYQDRDHNLAVEQFMQRYYRTIMELSRLNEMLLQLFQEAILLAGEPGETIPINRRFQAHKGFLEVVSPRVFQRYPFALLEVFLVLQQNPELKGVRASTIRLIRSNRHRINAKFRDDLRARTLFMEILRQPYGITHQLRRMNRYGVLAAYLPEFSQIVGRMQYDLFHAYTVDQHILFVVRNLRRFYVPKFAHEFPHCSMLIHRLPKPELLYIAGLYHDIAKGRGGDHSELGSVDAENFCRRHGLSEFDTRLVAWLVRNHLVMSLTAQKRDINDPEVINDFARRVGDQLHLNYLYLLTVADIRGTNPKLWNTWREALLKQLYDSTRRALRRGLGNPLDKEERIREIRDEARKSLLRKGIDERRIDSVWHSFTDDYFLRHTPEEIVWHTRAVLKKKPDDRALVLARDDPARGGTEIFVYTRDRDNIFAITTSVLDQLGLNIVDARIITSRCGYTLDSYTVLDAAIGEPIRERMRLKEVLGRLRRQLNRPDARPAEPNWRPSRVLKNFRYPTEVAITEDLPNGHTMIELVTSDRPGLLSRVGNAFTNCGIRLKNAKIATIGARAEDIFFVTDRQNSPLQNPARYQDLRESLIRNLEETDTVSRSP